MVAANNAIYNTVGASISGVTNTLTVTNPSNTASSAAREVITVGGGTAGDPTINWNVAAATDWEMGIDNSDSDKWKLSEGMALGTNDTIVAFTTGEVLKPRQPSFTAYANALLNNVTGDATSYTVLFNTVQYDVASNYNAGTGKFTAPVSGTYLFNTSITFFNISPAHTNFLNVFTSATKQARWAQGNPANIITPVGTAMCQNGSWLVQLTAGDQVSVLVQVSGGTKTVGIFGTVASPPVTSFFSGVLLC